MLNRNAEALFWVGRYMERVENHARLIDVYSHMLQTEPSPRLSRSELADTKWERIVGALGSRQDYMEAYSSFTQQDVLYYVSFDREQPNSLLSCVSHARDNLRTLREKVPTELWNVANGLYLWLREKDAREQAIEEPHMFFLKVKEWTALFQGMEQSVMPRENEWRFMESGRYLERAENTLRIMQSSGGFAHPAGENSGYSYLQAVLRAVSGYQVFRRYNADSVAADAIIAFLLLHDAFPRSVRFSLLEMDRHLQAIELQGQAMRQAQLRIIRQVGKLQAELTCMEPNELMPGRAGDIVYHLLQSCQILGQLVADTFFRYGEESA